MANTSIKSEYSSLIVEWLIPSLPTYSLFEETGNTITKLVRN